MGEFFVQLPASVSRTKLAAGWRVVAEQPLRLEGPEGDLRLAFLQLARGPAVQVATAAVVSVLGSTARVLNAVDGPASSGWEGVQQVIFDTSATPNAVLVSFSHLLHESAFTAILEGSRAAMDRRMGQIASILESWKPPGRSQDTLAGLQTVWDAEREKALDAFIAFAMQTAGVPGAAVAVVSAERPLHVAAYGVTRVGGAEPVTTQTQFRIGSTTKALTTLFDG